MQIYASELFVASCKVVCAAIVRARHPNPSQLWPPSSWSGVAVVYSLRLYPQVVKYHPGDNE